MDNYRKSLQEVRDCFVTIFEDGEIVSLEEARKINYQQMLEQNLLNNIGRLEEWIDD